MTSESFTPTERTRVRRNPKRATYDREVVHQVLDEAMLCHIALSIDGQPCVLPTIHTRLGNKLYLHGSNQNRMLNTIAEGATACISVTILDGLVLARSGLHHSMNYRSVVLYATGQKVECEDEKRRAMEALVEQIVPGRWEDARQPTQEELNATNVIVFPIDEASAKVRNGPPVDDDRDRNLPIWAGVVPVRLCASEPITDTAGIDVSIPSYVEQYRRLPKAVIG